MILRYCHRCQQAMPQGHRHRAPDTRPSARARGYDHRWQATRSSYLSAFPLCQWHGGCIAEATDVHHLDGKGPLGPRGHDQSNLQGLCHRHHSMLTARGRSTQPKLIVLIGRSGVGKSAVRSELGKRLGWPTLGPDDFNGDWTELMRRFAHTDKAIVECVRLHRRLRSRLKNATVVELHADHPSRERRLLDKLPSTTVRERLSESWDPGYGDAVTVHRRVDTTDKTPAEVADEILTTGGG